MKQMMMRLSSILLILHSLSVTINVAQGLSMAKPGCQEKCGNITAPYPFGIGPNCSAGSNFTVICNITTLNRPRLLSALNLEVRRFFFEQQTVEVKHAVSPMKCSPEQQTMQLLKLGHGGPYTLSSIYNKFVVTGCNNNVSILPSNEACNPSCSESKERGCNGIRRCQATIPMGLKELNISYHTAQPNNMSNTCGYTFLTEERWVKSMANVSFTNISTLNVPLVLHWELNISGAQNYKWVTCSNTCRRDNATMCYCEDGFEGAPLLPPGSGGCQDIDECKHDNLNSCGVKSSCVNNEGYFTCRDSNMMAIVGAGSGMGALLLLVGTWMSVKLVRKRNEVKRKTYLFRRNGGLLLQEQMPSNDNGGEGFRIFSSEELALATNHGGQGSVCKGLLADKMIVAVKKVADEAKKVDEASVRAFIMEVVILSQIKHKNIVRLLGCCLETEVPILVYEFIPKGMLFEYIHGRKHEFPWESRMRMTTEVAEAIAELHGAKPLPIYHRDVKSTNILLDDEYQAKVSDFGMPWSVSIDQNNQPTRLMLTRGYADPLYLQSSQYTEKSDVYSFGVVMVELLTGDKAVSEVKYEEGKKVLANRFLDAMERNNMSDIVDQEVWNGPKEEIMAFAELARRCLDLDGNKRPTMMEATKELVRITNPKEGTKPQSKLEESETDDVSDYPSTSTTPNLNAITGEP